MIAHNDALADIRRGIVRFVSNDRRFSFIETPGSRDVYVHQRTLATLPTLAVGSQVIFRLVTLADGRLIANDVALLDDDEIEPSHEAGTEGAAGIVGPSQEETQP